MTLGEKVKRACSFKSKKKGREKYDIQVKERETKEKLFTNEYTSLPFAYSMSDDRVMAEERCLKFQTRIMEQMRDTKQVDLELSHFEAIYQNQTEDDFNQQEEILYLENIIQLSERIIEFQNMINKSDKTIETMLHEINECRTDPRNRSFSEPVNQSTPLKRNRPISTLVDDGAPEILPVLTRTQSIKRTTSRFDTIYHTPKASSAKMRSQSYRETKSEISMRRPLIKTAPLSYFRSSERRLPIPVEIPKVPDIPNEFLKKKSFHPRLVIERKKDFDMTITRSRSEAQIVPQNNRSNQKLSLPTSKSDRKLSSYDNDSDTGVSSMHSSETEFRFSPDRNDRKITLV